MRPLRTLPLQLVGERTALKSNIITFWLELCNCSYKLIWPLASNNRCAPKGERFNESVMHLEISPFY